MCEKTYGGIPWTDLLMDASWLRQPGKTRAVVIDLVTEISELKQVLSRSHQDWERAAKKIIGLQEEIKRLRKKGKPQ